MAETASLNHRATTISLQEFLRNRKPTKQDPFEETFSEQWNEARRARIIQNEAKWEARAKRRSTQQYLRDQLERASEATAIQQEAVLDGLAGLFSEGAEDTTDVDDLVKPEANLPPSKGPMEPFLVITTKEKASRSIR